jgi:divalent metal cation (Fe/Co/Zn/Cd) transporter
MDSVVIVARYKGRVGRRIHSATLVADARHYSDEDR